MSKIIRRTALVLGFALVPLGLAVPAFASGAGHNPCPTPSVTLTAYTGHTPCPTPTPTDTGTPTPTPQRFAQEDFEVEVSSLRPQGEVLADGPVRFNVGQDRSLSPFEDNLFLGGNSVNLFHAPLGGVAIDTTTCSITLDQNDLRWLIRGGTGIYARAFGFGHYTLRGLFSFPTVRGQCSLPAGLTVQQAAQDLNRGGSGLPRIAYYDIAVQGTGVARVHHRHHHFGISPTAPTG